jgi:alginate O-acetyltransferase complex protein AlgI
LCAFLPLVVLLYYALARVEIAREWMLVVASAVFYGWWDPRFLPLIIGQTVASWLIARFFHRSRHVLLLGIAANLLILVYFKYLNFFAESIAGLTGYEVGPFSIILPIGISFYTFQIISYLADLKKEQASLYDFRRFLLYITLFPQLIAGPIVRHQEFIPQLLADPLRPGLWNRIWVGLTLFVFGLTKKVFFADEIAPVSDRIFEMASGVVPSFADAWTGALAFSLQLFFDFSAYSEMAIGIGLMMGFRFPHNFDAPYKSRNIQDFWRRWHMTLSRFFRDYLYIPLGGSRNGPLMYIGASLATMGLCGLWHGAAWTFVIWGLMHGLGLIVVRVWSKVGFELPFSAAWLLTMLFVIFGWVLFRSPDYATANNMVTAMISPNIDFRNFLMLDNLSWGSLGMLFATIVAIFAPTSKMLMNGGVRTGIGWSLTVSIVLVLCITHVSGGQPTAFIYFQF